jgi:hypothetical protein
MNSDDLNEMLDEEYAAAWISAEGDKLIGRVEGFGEWDAGYGSYPIVTVMVTGPSTEQGEAIAEGERRAVHCQATVLRSKLSRERPVIGDEIGLKNIGMRGTADRQYRDFNLRVAGRGERGLPDWDGIRRAADAEAAAFQQTGQYSGQAQAGTAPVPARDDFFIY